MLKRLRSECLIQLEISTDGPLLIKSGQTFATGADMTAVRTMRNGRWEVYIPGSSLKGALRAHAERIARTLAPNEHGCCDPFKKERAAGGPAVTQSCSERLKRMCETQSDKELDATVVYNEACPICKLFGCLFMAGRLGFNDAHWVSDDIGELANQILRRSQTIPPARLVDDIRRRLNSFKNPLARDVTQRSNVGIDRHTGGASGGSLFELEVVTAASFTTSLYLRNFELWQLGLLAFVLRDLENGVIKLGMGKSRGLGRIKATVTQLEVRYLGLNPPPQEGTLCELQGMRLLEPTEAGYSFWDSEQAVLPLYSSEQLPSNPVKTVPDNYGLRTVYSFDQAQCEHLWRKVAPLWVAYARQNPHAKAGVQ